MAYCYVVLRELRIKNYCTCGFLPGCSKSQNFGSKFCWSLFRGTRHTATVATYTLTLLTIRTIWHKKEMLTREKPCPSTTSTYNVIQDRKTENYMVVRFWCGFRLIERDLHLFRSVECLLICAFRSFSLSSQSGADVCGIYRFSSGWNSWLSEKE